VEKILADTSMITLSPEYAAHFHDIFIDGKECAKMTGDRMRMSLESPWRVLGESLESPW
jgi:hypothetical protein